MDVSTPQRPTISIARAAHPSPAGVLPVSTTGTKPKVVTQSSRYKSTGSKVVIRRLPPGLTEAEFNSYIGEEWGIGGSRVDWASYVPGKVSKEYVKSRNRL